MYPKNTGCYDPRSLKKTTNVLKIEIWIQTYFRPKLFTCLCLSTIVVRYLLGLATFFNVPHLRYLERLPLCDSRLVWFSVSKNVEMMQLRNRDRELCLEFLIRDTLSKKDSGQFFCAVDRLIHELLNHKQLVLSSSAIDQDHIAVSISQYRDYNKTIEDATENTV